MAEKPEKGQQYFAEIESPVPLTNAENLLMVYRTKKSWAILYFGDEFPFKIERWFSVDDLEKAEKRINHLENKRGSRCPCRFAKRCRCLYRT